MVAERNTKKTYCLLPLFIGIGNDAEEFEVAFKGIPELVHVVRPDK